MKIMVLLLSGLFLLNTTSQVMAQTNDQITDLQAEIVDLQTILKEKKAELKELRASQEGFYTIETNTATYTFSNPRIEDDLLLLDLDYTNDSKGSLDVFNDMWMLTFAQEDDISINQLWVTSENLPEVEGRRPLTPNIRLKSGATVQLIIGLTKSPTMLYMEMFNGEGSVEEPLPEDTTEDTATFDELSPLFIRVDQYSSPTGQSEEIEIPLQ